MDQSARYEEDIYAWSLRQAELLRGLARSGRGLPNALDLDHVAREIEDLGNEQRLRVESNLEQAFMHLIGLATQPGDDAFASCGRGRCLPAQSRAPLRAFHAAGHRSRWALARKRPAGEARRRVARSCPDATSGGMPLHA